MVLIPILSGHLVRCKLRIGRRLMEYFHPQKWLPRQSGSLIREDRAVGAQPIRIQTCFDSRIELACPCGGTPTERMSPRGDLVQIHSSCDWRSTCPRRVEG